MRSDRSPLPTCSRRSCACCAVWRCCSVSRSRADADRAADRRSQIGTGDRTERIRTYNFPQGRVTDHRINLTLYKIDKVMSGEALDEVIDALAAADRAAKLAMAEV